MTPEEKRVLIDEIKEIVKEEIILAIPDIIGNLMREQSVIFKLNYQYYKDHPEFTDHKDVVRAVTEATEGSHPGMSYEKILELATPKIRKQIGEIGKLDMKSANRPSRSLPRLTMKPDHGEL